MLDKTGKRIVAYRYGSYWFQVRGTRRRNATSYRISGLSGASFRDERELLKSYDSVNGEGRTDGPGLICVYQDGSEKVLRQGDNNKPVPIPDAEPHTFESV